VPATSTSALTDVAENECGPDMATTTCDQFPPDTPEQKQDRTLEANFNSSATYSSLAEMPITTANLVGTITLEEEVFNDILVLYAKATDNDSEVLTSTQHDTPCTPTIVLAFALEKNTFSLTGCLSRVLHFLFAS
jgi:hypothetical protein